MAGLHFRAHTNPTFWKNNILKLKELYELTVTMSLRKRIDNIGPDILGQIFQFKRTRTHIHFENPKPTCKFYDTMPNFAFTRIWNSFRFKDEKPSVNSFKNMVKPLLISRYTKDCNRRPCYSWDHSPLS